jgi:outer membrane protein OmpA-like peptidoglycan-associated protein
MFRTKLFHKILIFSLLSLILTGCATREAVRDDISASDEKQSQAIAELRQELTAEINRLEGAGQDASEALRLAREANQAMEELQAASRRDLAEKTHMTVFFGFDRHDLRDSAKASLDKVAAAMNDNSSYVAVLEGHTDGRGSESYNYALSYRRVAGVIGYLVAEKGIDLNRIHLIGLGEGYPAANNSSEEGRKLNRRVVISIRGPR